MLIGGDRVNSRPVDVRLELIIVDDASTDDTREFLRRQSDPRISWLVSDRQIGQPAAFNQALPKCAAPT
jgi:glycosyltransferase involved in cell wall biosynthesis